MADEVWQPVTESGAIVWDDEKQCEHGREWLEERGVDTLLRTLEIEDGYVWRIANSYGGADRYGNFEYTEITYCPFCGGRLPEVEG